MESENKYNREIYDIDTDASVTVDVYNVLVAFNVTCPARQHAIKKLLCAGLRGKGDSVQDLTEAGKSIMRAIRLEQRAAAMRVPTIGEGSFGVVYTECLVCHDKLNYPDGKMGDCLCPKCRERTVEPLHTPILKQTNCRRCGERIRYALNKLADLEPHTCQSCKKDLGVE